MNIECRDLTEKAEALLQKDSVTIEELAQAQRTVYTCCTQVRDLDERAGDILGILAYRLRAKMQRLCPEGWMQHL